MIINCKFIILKYFSLFVKLYDFHQYLMLTYFTLTSSLNSYVCLREGMNVELIPYTLALTEKMHFVTFVTELIRYRTYFHYDFLPRGKLGQIFIFH